MIFLQFTAKAATTMLISASCALSAYAQTSATINNVVTNIDVAQSRAMQKQGALLLDVREPDEFADGHAPGSKLIPLGQLQNRVNEIGDFKRNPVVIICRSGRRSMQAASILGQLGFTEIYNVQGGMIAWEKASLPINRPRK
jgi:rhodanese-related sulfurtransferase